MQAHGPSKYRCIENKTRADVVLENNDSVQLNNTLLFVKIICPWHPSVPSGHGSAP